MLETPSLTLGNKSTQAVPEQTEFCYNNRLKFSNWHSLEITAAESGFTD
jgi:hypothetical protein